MEFESYLPSEHLRSVVAYYWTLRSVHPQESSSVYRFIPDGYTDWIFHREEPWSLRRSRSLTFERTALSHIFGQLEGPVDLVLPEKGLDFFAIKFQPWAGSLIFGHSMSELKEDFSKLEDVIMDHGHLAEMLNEAMYVKDKIGHAERYLETILSGKDRVDLRVSEIFACSEGQWIDRRAFELGARRLQQLFKEQVGISAKRTEQILRINAAISMIRTNGLGRIYDIAFDGGYYDQAHFNREFKRYTGLNPTSFVNSIDPSGDIFNLKVAC